MVGVMASDLFQRQVYAAILWGVAFFAAGLAITYAVLPEPFIEGVEQWKAVTWIYLNANGVLVSPNLGLMPTFQEYDILAANSEFWYLKALPPTAAGLTALLTIESVGSTRRLSHLLENGLIGGMGYVAATAGAVIVSDARPGMSILFLLGLAFVIGIFVFRAISTAIPILAIASLGTVLLLGFVVLVGGVGIIEVFGSTVVIALVAAAAASILVYAARNLPF